LLFLVYAKQQFYLMRMRAVRLLQINRTDHTRLRLANEIPGRLDQHSA